MTRLKYFFVNGQKFCTRYNITLFHLILYFNYSTPLLVLEYNTSLLVLEYNNLVCNKKNWDTIFIQDNDKIEIVTIVGGG
jgi:thiamine biosynthesis protein ThiS